MEAIFNIAPENEPAHLKYAQACAQFLVANSSLVIDRSHMDRLHKLQAEQGELRQQMEGVAELVSTLDANPVPAQRKPNHGK